MRHLLVIAALVLIASCSNSPTDNDLDLYVEIKSEAKGVIAKDELIRAFTSPAIKSQGLSIEAQQRANKMLMRGDWRNPAPRPKSLTIKSVGSLPDEIDLSKYDTSVKQQVGPRCTAWSYVAGLENELMQLKKADWDLDEMAHWNKYAVYRLDSSMQAGVNYKTPDQGQRNPHAITVKYRYLGDDVQALHAALADGHVAQLATRTPNSMLNCDAVLTDYGFSDGGHALSIVGITKDDQIPGGYALKLKNSWGSNCGQNGYQYYPVSLCWSSGGYCEFYSIEKVSSDKLSNNPTPTPEPDKCPWWKKLLKLCK